MQETKERILILATDNSSPDFESVGAISRELPATNREPKNSNQSAVISKSLTKDAEKSSIVNPQSAIGGGMFSALRHPNYRTFWIGAGFANIGSWIHVVAQNWLVLSLTGSPFMLGLISFAGNLPLLLLSLLGGVIADRNSRQKILFVAQLAMAILFLALAVMIFFNIINIWLVLLVAVGIGIVQAFSSPAYQTIMLDLVPKKDLLNAIALSSVQFNLARIIGPSIAGILVSAVGIAFCYFLSSTLSFIVLASLFLIKLPAVLPREVKRSIGAEIKESFVYLRSQKVLVTLLVLSAGFSLFVLPYLTLLPVFVKQVFKGNSEDYGLLLTGVGVGALIGALTMARQSESLRRRGVIMLGGIAMMLTALFLFGLMGNKWLGLPFLALAGASMVTVNSLMMTVVQTSVPDALRGRILSIWTLFALGTMPVGNLISGTGAEWFGAPLMLCLNMVVFAVVTVCAVIYTPKLRDL
jgi:MFS family permease